MNKKLFGIIIAVVAIGAIAGIVVATQPGKNTATHSSSGNDMEQMQEAEIIDLAPTRTAVCKI